MSLQTRKAFIHLRDKNEDIFLWNLRALWPSIETKDITTNNGQKRSKDIGKIVHVT